MSLALESNLDRSTTTLARALGEVVKGEIFTDPFTRSMYATDASIYEIEPLIVVHPLDELDVRGCLWFGAKHGVPVIARGGGTGLAGESLGKAIIMDLNVHMNRILELDKGRSQVTVQTGVVLDSLNRALAPHGYRFAVDPSSSSRCTIGGMIANNASGAHSLRYGDTRQNLIAARVCMMDGTVTLANPVKMSSGEYENKKKEEGFSGKVHRELPELVKKNAELIASKKIKAERNRSGYLLDGVVDGEVYDLTRVVCGSEGTLGVVTQAVLKVELIANRTGMAVIYFGSILDAAKAIPAIRETKPVACELLDERLMAAGRQTSPAVARLLPEDSKAMLIVEYEGQDEAETTRQLEALSARLPAGSYQKLGIVLQPEDQVAVWATRDAATPLLFRRKDGLQPVPVVEDGAVPIYKLATYVEKASAIFDKYGLEWSAYAHAGHGEVHLRPLMDLRRVDHYNILEKMAGEVHAAVWECGGTISGEHAEGLVRTQFVEKQAGKELYAVFKAVKELFDPQGLLNPDKKISNDPHLMLRNLRFGPDYEISTTARPKALSIDKNQAANYRMFKSQLAIRTENTVESYASNPLDVHHHGVSPLNWNGREMADEVERCNGCGHCRTTGRDEDMCPRFKYERIEDASPRAKANVLRRLMTGRQREGAFNSEELIEIMDTCFNCKLCHSDCPSGVNIPKIVQEAKARYHQSHGLSCDKWMLTQSEKMLRAGMWITPLANTLTAVSPFRRLLELMTGIDHRRALPKLKKWRIRRRFTPSPQSGRPNVVLYVDLARYIAPEVIQSAVDVLEHNGFEVEIPDVPWCNMPALSEGAVMQAREHVTKVAELLAPYAFKGTPILALDSTACLALQQEFLTYVDTPQTRAVSRHTREIIDFLVELKNTRKLKVDFKRVDMAAAYHQPCHHKALGIGAPSAQLLKQIPGLHLNIVDQGCCGNPAGWGMMAKNYEESMWIGKNVFKECASKRLDCAVSESNCCRSQIEHGSGKKSLHPIQIVAQAYGYEVAQPREEGLDKLDLPEKKTHHDDHAHIHVEPPKPAMSHGHAHDAHTQVLTKDSAHH